MDKKFLYEIIEENAPTMITLSDKIWDLAELSMEEYQSAEYYCNLLEQEGFTVRRNLCGIPTAFSASYGSGSPRIGILGEFDALSGLSQVPGTARKECLTEGGNGQGCGHNLLGAAAFGGALAVKKAIQAGLLQGTVIFYGCPGEEGCAGKTFMARDGMFRDLDAALCWHPGDTNEVTTGTCNASLQVEYTFTGTASHAAGDPEHGRSALDAAELMNIGVQFLREHMPKNCCLHYSFLDAGGVSPNVVQPTATVLYMVRGDSVRSAKALLDRVNKIAEGAALMTETTFTSRQIDGTSDTVSNTVIEQLIYQNLKLAPLPTYTAEEVTFAQAMKATCGEPKLPGNNLDLDKAAKKQVKEITDGGKLALNNFIMPYIPSSRMSAGSTDVGDVSWLAPTAQFTAATWVSGSPGHSWQNVAGGKHPIAHKGLVYAAKVLAATAADLMEQPEVLTKAKEEFLEATADGYDCPIGKEVTF